MSSPQADGVASPFAPYATDLSHFFARRSMPYGDPTNILGLVEQIGTCPVFHDELFLLLRTALLASHEGITRSQLLELVAFAIGGPDLDLRSPEFKEPVRQLFSFTCAVLSSLQKTNATTTGEHSSVPVAVRTEDAAIAPQPGLLHHLRWGTSAVSGPETSTQRIFPAHTLYSRSLLDSLCVERSAGSNQADIRVPAEVGARDDVQPAPNLPSTDRLAQADAQNAILTISPRRRLLSWIGGSSLAALCLAATLRHPQNPNAASIPVEKQHDRALGSAPRRAFGSGDLSRSKIQAERSRADGSDPRHLGNTYVRLHRTSPFVPALLSIRTAALWPAALRSGPTTPAPVAPSASGPPSAPVRTPVVGPPVAATPASPALRPDVFLASSGIMTANLLSAPAPAYPPRASATEIEGQVTLEALVGRDGTVIATHQVEGNRLLGDAAEAAVRQWRYRPYLIQGKPTLVTTRIAVSFRLLR